jgi:dihydrofolate synthase/folylpolyglutamate synthase
VRRGLGTVRLEGRLQPVRARPLLVVDGAHNGASMRAAVAALRAVHPGGRLRAVFAANRDKDARGMFRALRGAARVFVATMRGPRAADAAGLVSLARAAGLRASAAGSAADAVRAALRASAPGDAVLVAGSLYLAGEVLPSLRSSGSGGRPPVRRLRETGPRRASSSSIVTSIAR